MTSTPQRMPVCSAISKELERQRTRASFINVGGRDGQCCAAAEAEHPLAAVLLQPGRVSLLPKVSQLKSVERVESDSPDPMCDLKTLQVRHLKHGGVRRTRAPHRHRGRTARPSVSL